MRTTARTHSSVRTEITGSDTAGRARVWVLDWSMLWYVKPCFEGLPTYRTTNTELGLIDVDHRGHVQHVG